MVVPGCRAVSEAVCAADVERTSQMEQKLVFFDIDDTLYSGKTGVPDSAVRGIELLKERGHIPVICTGRTKACVFDSIRQMDFAGYICGVGTYVEYAADVIYNWLAPRGQGQELAELFRWAGVKFFLEGPSYIYYDERDHSPENQELIREMGNSLEKVLAPVDGGHSEFNKLIAVRQPGDRYDEITSKLTRDYRVIQYYDSPFVEIVPVGHSKATGIKRLLEHLGIDRRHTYAFGDSKNDLEMLEYVEYGIAMGNAYHGVLDRAKYKTRRLEEDGIYYGLKEFGLI